MRNWSLVNIYKGNGEQSQLNVGNDQKRVYVFGSGYLETLIPSVSQAISGILCTGVVTAQADGH